MSRRGLFFDMDGTLVDTDTSNTAAYSDAIRRVLPGTDIDVSKLRGLIAGGLNYRVFLPQLIQEISDASIENISKEKAAVYPKYIPLSVVNRRLVAWIRQQKSSPDVTISLVTTAKKKNAVKVLAFHQLTGLFDSMIFGDGVARLKPYPDIYLKALQVTELKSDQAQAFEDSSAGCQAALGAGISVTKVTWSRRLR